MHDVPAFDRPESADVAYLATKGPDGPRIVPVFAVSYRGALWIASRRGTAKVRAVRRDAAVAVCTRQGDRWLSIRGDAMLLDPLRPASLLTPRAVDAPFALSKLATRTGHRVVDLWRRMPFMLPSMALEPKVLMALTPTTTTRSSEPRGPGVPAALAWSTPLGPSVAPVRWDASTSIATLTDATLASVFLRKGFRFALTPTVDALGTGEMMVGRATFDGSRLHLEPRRTIRWMGTRVTAADAA